MKKTVTNILLGAAFCGCLAWAAVAPRLQAMIPAILAIIIAEAFASVNSSESIKTTR